jgi:hypothetical protein
MSDSITVSEALERATGKLDLTTKELYLAQKAVETAEEAWEVVFDSVAESLEDEYREKGRKAAPSENAITMATRRSNRELYVAMKRAKRRVERAQEASKNRRQQASSYQTMMNNLGAEAMVQDYLAQRVEEPGP